MTVNGLKSASVLNWEAPTDINIKASIDQAKGMGLNCILIALRGNYATLYRTSTTDPLKGRLDYASSQGVKVIVLIDIDDYPAGGRETFFQSATRQQQFLTDMKWMADRYKAYPAFQGFELEEPHRYGSDSTTAQAIRTVINAFFLKCKALVPAGKDFGFNLASLTRTNQLLQGIDPDFINANSIFTFYAPQLAKNSLSVFQSSYDVAKGEFPGLVIIPHVYTTYSSLTGCCCPSGSTWDNVIRKCKTSTGTIVPPTPGSCRERQSLYNDWNTLSCWNQAFITERQDGLRKLAGRQGHRSN